jgi:malonyl-CoA/methylmalonyl-CoA synthetase
MGRASVDIIKTAGYKISALDVEREILEFPGSCSPFPSNVHPLLMSFSIPFLCAGVLECAVVGVDDKEYGQVVSAIVVFKVWSFFFFPLSFLCSFSHPS